MVIASLRATSAVFVPSELMDSDLEREDLAPKYAHRRKMSASGVHSFANSSAPAQLVVSTGVPAASGEPGGLRMSQSNSMGNISAYVASGSLHHRDVHHYPGNGVTSGVTYRGAAGNATGGATAADPEDDKARKAMLHSAPTTVGVTGFVAGYPMAHEHPSRPASPSSVSTASTVVSVSSASTPISSSPSSPEAVSLPLLPSDTARSGPFPSLLGFGSGKAGKVSPPPPYSYHGNKPVSHAYGGIDDGSPAAGLPTFAAYGYPRVATASPAGFRRDRGRGQFTRTCNSLAKKLCTCAGLVRLLKFAVVLYVVGTVVFTTWHIAASWMGWSSPATTLFPGVGQDGRLVGQFMIDKDGNRATVVWSKDGKAADILPEAGGLRADGSAKVPRGGNSDLPRRKVAQKPQKPFLPPRLNNLDAIRPVPVPAPVRKLERPVLPAAPAAAVSEEKKDVPVEPKKEGAPIAAKEDASAKPSVPSPMPAPVAAPATAPSPVDATAAAVAASVVNANTATTSATVGDGIFDFATKDFMLSKLFQFAMKPFRIEPFYIRATHVPEPDDITITTMLDPSRYDRLLKLVYQYKGPISVTIHLQDDDPAQVEEAISELEELVQQHPIVGEFVDAHLLIDRFDRQFNLWRNVARFFARSKYVVQLDVDFFVCTDFRANIKKNPELLHKMDQEKGVLVIPAFEFNNDVAPKMESDKFPKTKDVMVDMYKKGDIIVFHADWERGHGPTNYQKWFATNEPYQISTYNFNYEPYVIMRRDDPPWCDERFVGYGSNKAACLYEIYLAGYEFWVLPEDFLIHQWHEYPSEERTAERKYNRALYETFREETCFRYNRLLQMATSQSGNGDTDLYDRLDCMQFAGSAGLSKGLIKSVDEDEEEEDEAAPTARDRGL